MMILSSLSSIAQNNILEKELPLPVPPSDMTIPAERADFIISHFWDAMDFSNPSMAEDHDFIEQNFVNYINLFPHANQKKIPASLKSFLNAADTNPKSAEFIYALADKYLMTKDSPMRNEGYHILFLENAINSQSISEADRIRAGYRLESELKNRPGTKAPDFRFVDRDGESGSLSRLNNDNNILLIFYDPDCNHCMETIDIIKTLPLPDSTGIVAIDISGNRDLWNSTKDSLPENWTIGFATDPIQDNETFIFEEMPTLYLLSPSGEIILKDATIRELTDESDKNRIINSNNNETSGKRD